jgi:RNA-directed DNA polymerase
VQRVHTQRYRAKLVRRCCLPHAHGTARPLGMPALEDTLGPLAGATLWTARSAQDVRAWRDGYRPGRGAWEAVRALPFALPDGRPGDLGERLLSTASWPTGTIRGCGDRGRLRLADRALRHLRRPGLQARLVDTEGPVGHPETGTPQGGTVSPVLATVSRHEALDLWGEHVGQPHGRGAALWCREADDWGWACRVPEDAARCCRVFPTRLAQVHLQVAPAPPHLRRFSRVPPSKRRRCTLLGFACCWRPERHGVPRVRRRTARKKLHAACPRLTAWSKHHRHLPGRAGCQRLQARLRGHDNYDGVRGTSCALHRFFPWARDCPCTWRNRRGGQQRSDTWEQCPHVLDRVTRARPRITEVPRRSVLA